MAGKDQTKLKVAKVFGIDARRPEEPVPSIHNADIYLEEEPTVAEWAAEHTPTLRDVGRYIYNLFPFISWIGKYNWTWFLGDFIAGTTVGAVVVPQSMAYAQLATLDVEYGLYSSFMGVLIYWFFATSKDITIGPVAVMSQVTGNVVTTAREELPDIPPNVIASALAVIAGAIICFLGLARLGWIVEFIPLPAICAFMTGSAINIISGQVPKLMGISGVKTRGRGTHLVIIDTLKGLPRTSIDASLGLTALTMLYVIRGFCSYMAKKQPHRSKMWFLISTLRTAFVILLYTGISAGVLIQTGDNEFLDVVGDVPSGFQHAAVPKVTTRMISAFANELPAAVIVMLIEHISISKSFGRVNNYVIDPSQELVAIGVTNLLGPFLGAYPATGSFSRTAIKSKAGVRTPFAGVITAIVVLLALYALTKVFFYIPNAGLAAVIIHAVGDVITPPRTVYQFWRVAPHEVVIFFAGVLVTVFTNIENGVYTTICVSFVVLIWRLFLSKGRFLGRARVRTVRINDGGRTPSSDGDSKEKEAGFLPEETDEEQFSPRPGFLPIEHRDGSNPSVAVDNPYPGVFVYRFAEGFNYPNASRYLNHLTETIFRDTRRTDISRLGKLGDRPWNDAGPRHIKDEHDPRPTLKAIVLDFATVNHIDATSIQTLLDTKHQLDRYTAPDTVDWHFANISSRWTKRGLVAAGFGLRGKIDEDDGTQPTIFSIAEFSGAIEPQQPPREDIETQLPLPKQTSSDDDQITPDKGSSVQDGKVDILGAKPQVLLQGLNRPLFHFDLQEAVEAAVADAKTKTF
jgi:sodium-independent sulfate anion transporter 11